MIRKRNIIELKRLAQSDSFDKLSGVEIARKLRISLDEVFYISENSEIAEQWAKSNIDVTLEQFIESIRCAKEL